jgi:hypothetical protein
VYQHGHFGGAWVILGLMAMAMAYGRGQLQLQLAFRAALL